MSQTLELLSVLDLTVAHRRGAGAAGTPAPRASPVKLPDVENQRSLCCASYDQCLDVAVARGWPSWTCTRCATFLARREIRAAEFEHEASRRLGAPDCVGWLVEMRSTPRR